MRSLAKEKVKKSDEEEVVNHDLIYEIVGLFSICLALIIWEKLGNVGLWMHVLIKIIFGNWFWLSLLYLLIFGIRALFLRKMINFKSARTNGFLFLLFSLMLLSNTSLYNESIMINKNFIAGVWDIMMSYAANPELSIDLGGGLLGSLVYQALVFLLGIVGTLIVSVFLLLLSLILLTNNNLSTFFDCFKGFIKSFIRFLQD